MNETSKTCGSGSEHTETKAQSMQTDAADNQNQDRHNRATGTGRLHFLGIIVGCVGVILLMLCRPTAADGFPQTTEGEPPLTVPQRAERAKDAAMLRENLNRRLKIADAALIQQKAKANDLRSRIGLEHTLDRKIVELEQKLAVLLKAQHKNEQPVVPEQLTARMKAADATIREQTAKAEDLRRQIEKERALDRELHACQDQADKAEKNRQTSDAAERLAIAERIERAKAARMAADAELEKLRAELAEAQKALTNANASVTVPSLPGEGKVQPVYIECDGAGLTIYKLNGAQVEQIEVPLDSVKSSSQLSSVASDVASKAKSGGALVVNFLVRPAGVKAYRQAQTVMVKAEAPFASVPIKATGKVRIELPNSVKPSV